MKKKKTLLISVFVFICLASVLVIRFNLTHFSPKISPTASKEECLEVAWQYLEKDEPESAIYPLLLAVQKDEGDFRAHSLLAWTTSGVRGARAIRGVFSFRFSACGWQVEYAFSSSGWKQVAVMHHSWAYRMLEGCRMGEPLARGRSGQTRGRGEILMCAVEPKPKLMT